MGAVCAAFGLAISAAAPNLIFLFLSIGIVTGKKYVNQGYQFHEKDLKALEPFCVSSKTMMCKFQGFSIINILREINFGIPEDLEIDVFAIYGL